MTVLPGPSGCLQHAPGVQVHQLRWSLVSTGPSVMRNTSEPGPKRVGVRAGVKRRVERAFGDRDVARGRDEGGELGVGDGGGVGQEPVHLGAVRRPFIGVVPVGPHQEFPAGDPPHPVRGCGGSAPSGAGGLGRWGVGVIGRAVLHGAGRGGGPG